MSFSFAVEGWLRCNPLSQHRQVMIGSQPVLQILQALLVCDHHIRPEALQQPDVVPVVLHSFAQIMETFPRWGASARVPDLCGRCGMRFPEADRDRRVAVLLQRPLLDTLLILPRSTPLAPASMAASTFEVPCPPRRGVSSGRRARDAKLAARRPPPDRNPSGDRKFRSWRTHPGIRKGARRYRAQAAHSHVRNGCRSSPRTSRKVARTFFLMLFRDS